MSATLSVVVTTYNRPAKLLRFLESVAEQSMKPDEVIVINDGSTADYSESKHFIQSADNIQWVDQENAGVSAARNHGASKATGEFIAFCDDDDYWLPEHLSILGRAIEQSNQAPGLYHTQRRELRGNQYSDPPVYERPAGWTWQEHYITLGEMIPSATCMHRDIIQFSPFPVGIKYAEDHEQRLIALSRYPCFPLPERTVIMDRTDESATNTSATNLASIYTARFRHMLNHQAIRPYVRRKIRNRALYRWTSLELTEISQTNPRHFLKAWLKSLFLVKSEGNLKTWALQFIWHIIRRSSNYTIYK